MISHTMPPPKTGVGPQTTSTTYDPEFGRLETITDPTGRAETRAYYADGTLKTQTWTLGADAPEVDSYWINSRGWRTKSKVAIGTDERVESTGFDRAGQRLSDTMVDGDVYGRQFALSGAQVRLTYPGGEYNEFQHDARGLRKEVIANFWGISIPFASYTYDDDGRQKTELLQGLGGPTRNADYNAAGQLASVTQTIQRPDSTWETYTAALTYRQDGRIATETVNAEPTITYDYDNAGQLTSAVDGVNDYSYDYGSRGNRLSTIHNGALTTYDTNPNGSVAKTTTGNDTVDYFYDNAGRRQLTADRTNGTLTAIWGTIYNTRGLPGIASTGTVGSPADVEVRHYNTDGLMTSGEFTTGTGPTNTVDYQWDTNQAVPQYIDVKVDGTRTTSAYTGTNRVVLQAWPNGPLLFQYDAHGSAIRKEPTNTNIVDGPQSYDPNGGSDYTQNTVVGYRAELSSSDLLYLRNRNYDPETGQFTTPDPLDGVDGTTTVANRYHYADNDPLNKTDPLGLRPCDVGMDASTVMAGPVPADACSPPPCPVVLLECAGSAPSPEAVAACQMWGIGCEQLFSGGLTGAAGAWNSFTIGSTQWINPYVRVNGPVSGHYRYQPYMRQTYGHLGNASTLNTINQWGGRVSVATTVGLSGYDLYNTHQAYSDVGGTVQLGADLQSASESFIVGGGAFAGATYVGGAAAGFCVTKPGLQSVSWACGLGGGIAGGFAGTAAGDATVTWLREEAGFTPENFSCGLNRIGSWINVSDTC